MLEGLAASGEFRRHVGQLAHRGGPGGAVTCRCGSLGRVAGQAVGGRQAGGAVRGCVAPLAVGTGGLVVVVVVMVVIGQAAGGSGGRGGVAVGESVAVLRLDVAPVGLGVGVAAVVAQLAGCAVAPPGAPRALL